AVRSARGRCRRDRLSQAVRAGRVRLDVGAHGLPCAGPRRPGDGAAPAQDHAGALLRRPRAAPERGARAGARSRRGAADGARCRRVLNHDTTTGTSGKPSAREADMQATMMMMPLSIPSILRHAATHHGDTAIVSRTSDGIIHRYDYAGAWRRAQQLAHALVAL